MKKKILAMLLAAVMAFSLLPATVWAADVPANDDVLLVASAVEYGPVDCELTIQWTKVYNGSGSSSGGLSGSTVGSKIEIANAPVRFEAARTVKTQVELFDDSYPYNVTLILVKPGSNVTIEYEFSGEIKYSISSECFRLNYRGSNLFGDPDDDGSSTSDYLNGGDRSSVTVTAEELFSNEGCDAIMSGVWSLDEAGNEVLTNYIMMLDSVYDGTVTTEPEDPTEPTDPTEPETPTSGACGDNLTWSYSDGVLTIAGTGTMYDFIFNPDDPDTYNAPWRDYCWDINAVIIGDGVTSIGEFAFWVCGSLTSVTIPAGVTSVGVGAFNTCLSLTDINVASGNPAYTSVDGVLFNADQTLLHTYPAGKRSSSYSIPASVTTIGKYAFYEQVSLTGVTVPASVTTIDKSAFSECLNLAEVYYGGSEKQWSEISIGDDNDALRNAKIHCAGTDPEPTEPTEPTQPETPAFKDVPADAYYAGAVQFAVGRKLISGYGNSFGPNDSLTRGVALMILGRMAGVDVEGADPWYQKAVDWAVGRDLSDGTSPTSGVTREQLVVMLWRYAGKPAVDASVLDSYPDNADIHNWADFREAMAWAVANGIVLGSGGKLRPLNITSRAEAVTMVQRYYENWVEFAGGK